jgi:outer membrane protein OmpA-like peptidoglycan-associated protein
MKNLFLTAAFLLFAFGANAQKSLAVENQYPGDARAQKEYSIAVEKQSNEKTSAIRTTWLSSRPSSDWFISLQAGMGGILSDKNVEFTKPWKWFSNEHQGFWHPQAGLSVGKWITPVSGFRLNGNYGNVEVYNKEIYAFDTDYIAVTADYLLNLKNVFRPYNPKGFFNPVLYAGLGGFHTLKDGNRKATTFLTEKVGLQLNFRLCDACDLFLDGNVYLTPDGLLPNTKTPFLSSGVITNASIGFTYKINFRKFVKAPLYDQNEIDALLAEINALRNRPEVVCPPVVVCPEVKEVVVEKAKEVTLEPVFFTLGSATVRDNQLLNVAKAAEYLLDHPSAKLELASYADKKTGSAKRNLQLSKQRSEAVAKILTGKFGIDKSRLTLKHYGDTVQPFAENDWNRVTIFVK